MPIYEYQCQSCGHQFEALQKMSDPLLTDCPVCAKAELKKMVSAAAFKLKGKGWYETDFKNNGKVASGDAKDKAKSGSDSATKTAASQAESKSSNQSTAKQSADS